jgi:hypothetical protein
MNKPIDEGDVTRVAVALIGSTSSVIAVMYRLDLGQYDVDEMVRRLDAWCHRDGNGKWVANDDHWEITKDGHETE